MINNQTTPRLLTNEICVFLVLVTKRALFKLKTFKGFAFYTVHKKEYHPQITHH